MSKSNLATAAVEANPLPDSDVHDRDTAKIVRQLYDMQEKRDELKAKTCQRLRMNARSLRALASDVMIDDEPLEARRCTSIARGVAHLASDMARCAGMLQALTDGENADA